MPRNRLTLSQARRMALAAQGFGRPRPPGRVDVRHVRRALDRLGLVQLDYVNVLAPAHYQVLFSRLGPYDRSRLDDAVYRRREYTEQWAHEASIVPVDCWPLLAHRRRRHRVRPRTFSSFMEQNPAVMQAALGQVEERGPLTAAELQLPDGMARRFPSDWGGSIPKAVLEAHFGFGRLAVAGRQPNFARLYDLAERVIPEPHQEVSVDRGAARRRLLLRAARAHGVATAADLADYWRMPPRAARRHLDELVEEGELSEVEVDGWRQTAYLHPEARLPRRIAAAALLSPFDPVVWTRPRAARLFGFEYRIEIYTPAAKRRWGYYVLPFLLGERLVARVDLKADRTAGRLRVQAAYLESHAAAGEVAPALAAELASLAQWLELEAVEVAGRGDLAAPLSRAVEARC